MEDQKSVNEGQNLSTLSSRFPRPAQQRLKFSHRYRLLKELPSYEVGRTLAWDGNAQRFYFKAISEWKHDNGAEGIYLDKEGPNFTIDQIQDVEWFLPIGRLVEFIPPFPSKAKLEEFIYLTPDCRLVNDVDECRAINAMLGDKAFQKRLYEFYKTQYESFHGLSTAGE